MGLVTNRTGDVAQMGFMGISVFKIFWLRLLGQLVHRSMTGQTAVVFNRHVGRGQCLTVALGTTHPGFGMEVIRKARTGPRAKNLLDQGHVVAFGSTPGTLLTDQPERLTGRPGVAGLTFQTPLGWRMGQMHPGGKPVLFCRTGRIRRMTGCAGGKILPLNGGMPLRKGGRKIGMTNCTIRLGCLGRLGRLDGAIIRQQTDQRQYGDGSSNR